MTVTQVAEQRARPSCGYLAPGGPAAQGVSVRRLVEADVGAGVTQQLGGVRPGDAGGQIEHAQRGHPTAFAALMDRSSHIARTSFETAHRPAAATFYAHGP
ncbi:MAG: hypothetical protein V9E89_01720 [Ilumatobacteraceae bacterium]